MKDYLLKNSYPGRGIMIGVTPDGCNAIIAYFIMGRSINSRNRIFVRENENIKILPYDESKVQDSSLIIYYPLKQFNNYIIITNGDQTDTIYEYLKLNSNFAFEEALSTRTYEPDKPNYTPRISGILDLNNISYKLSILKKSYKSSENCDRFFYNYNKIAGIAHLIHTYSYEDENKVMNSFNTNPIIVKTKNNINKFSEEIWNALNFDNKIALMVRYINVNSKRTETIIINKYE